jgi:hypothetical protein
VPSFAALGYCSPCADTAVVANAAMVIKISLFISNQFIFNHVAKIQQQSEITKFLIDYFRECRLKY